ncbi:helix-turn-helix transcriptional regulator [Conexibacter arvalis]|uniref:DNA-binding XRE family transcriptional regulator n=1 Tax=Conexibacter arvalis TaxID=912552 RepID=A0A840ID28_9ACTN|nr:DNA-binding XRE family transcriptional regulator [Conexibacter arvalis]
MGPIGLGCARFDWLTSAARATVVGPFAHEVAPAALQRPGAWHRRRRPSMRQRFSRTAAAARVYSPARRRWSAPLSVPSTTQEADMPRRPNRAADPPPSAARPRATAPPVADAPPATDAAPGAEAKRPTAARRPVRSPLGREHVVLGRAVRELRARRFLTQAGLGTEAGLHRNYVGAIERGEINPTFRILRKLATGLQLPLSELIALFEQRWAEWEADRC